jgi:Na+(H+)/acetate symporter ActP
MVRRLKIRLSSAASRWTSGYFLIAAALNPDIYQYGDTTFPDVSLRHYVP